MRTDSMHVLALMEALTVTGPAKNLIQFCKGAGAAKVTVATFFRGDPRQEPKNQFIAAVRQEGIELDIITERFRFDLGVIRQLREAVRRRSPDIVQTHGVKSHFVMRRFALRRDYRWVAFHHGYTAEDLKMRLYNQLNRWSLAAADRVVTVCRPFAEMLAGNGVEAERIRVLPNMIAEAPQATESEVHDLREGLGIRPGECFILSVGRLSREKAQLDLVCAAAEMARLHPRLAFRLVFVGDGPQRSKLERASAVLRDRVVFTGYQQDVAPYYGAADLFVLPSHSEGSPNVLLEAMVAGVPIVATAVGGVSETVTDGQSGLLVPAAAPAALADAMGRLLTDVPLARRLAANARSAVLLRHSPAAYRQSLLGIYEDVLQGG